MPVFVEFLLQFNYKMLHFSVHCKADVSHAFGFYSEPHASTLHISTCVLICLVTPHHHLFSEALSTEKMHLLFISMKLRVPARKSFMEV